jgi:3'(2'), 5'-bisphosphate nucleotidase
MLHQEPLKPEHWNTESLSSKQAALVAATFQAVQLSTELGERALQLRSDGLEVLTKADGSLVTNADIEISKLLEEKLPAVLDVPVVSEESIQAFLNGPHQQSSQFWLVDPIDGTATFAGGYNGFAISIALIQDKRPVLGVVSAPALDCCYYATEGCGATRRSLSTGAEIPLHARATLDRPFRFAGYFHTSDSQTELLQKTFLTAGITSAEIVPVAAALKYCQVAEGQVHGAGGFRDLHIWDLAGVHPVVTEAGGTILNPVSGKPFTYDTNNLTLPSPFAFGSTGVPTELLPALTEVRRLLRS